MIALISRKESIKKWVPYFGLNSRVNDPAFLFLELASGFPVFSGRTSTPPGDTARAVRIIERVLVNQFTAPGQPWDGTYRRAPEEADPPAAALRFGSTTTPTGASSSAPPLRSS